MKYISYILLRRKLVLLEEPIKFQNNCVPSANISSDFTCDKSYTLYQRGTSGGRPNLFDSPAVQEDFAQDRVCDCNELRWYFFHLKVKREENAVRRITKAIKPNKNVSVCRL
jgi:hypothetical protein